MVCFSLPANHGFPAEFSFTPWPEIMPAASRPRQACQFPLQHPRHPSSNIGPNSLLLIQKPPPSYHIAVLPALPSLRDSPHYSSFKSLECDSGLRSMLALLDFRQPQTTSNQYILDTVCFSCKCRFKTNSLVARTFLSRYCKATTNLRAHSQPYMQ